MDVLNTREWAVVFWVCVLLILVLRRQSGRASVGRGIKGLFERKILLTFMALFAWLVFVVILAERIGVWDRSLLKDTLVWFLVGGATVPFAALEATQKDDFFRRHIRKVIGFATFLGFFLNLRTFNFFVELLLQPVVALLVGLSVVAGHRKEQEQVKRLADALLAIIGSCVFIGAAWLVAGSWRSFDGSEEARKLALSIWLPLAALPFMVGLATVMAYGSLFSMMRVRAGGNVPRKVRIGVLLALGGRLKRVHDLQRSYKHSRSVAEARTLKEVSARVRAFEIDRAAEAADNRQRAENLVKYAGVKGTDSNGTILDKRELSETKSALRFLATCHMGHYRNRGHYRSDLIDKVLQGFEGQGLPDPHGVVMRVRTDGQAWYAWRRTPSGYVLGIGAGKEPPDQWLYEGPEPPRTFPCEGEEWGSAWDTPLHWRSED